MNVSGKIGFRRTLDGMVPELELIFPPRFGMALYAQFRPRIARTKIVISAHEVKLELGQPFPPCDQIQPDLLGPSLPRMEKIAKKNKGFRLCAGDQLFKEQTVVTGRGFRNRNARLPKSRRLSEVGIRDEESFSLLPENRLFRADQKRFPTPV